MSLATFYDTLYGQQSGWLELCYIDGDPSARPAPRLKRARWYHYTPAKRQDLAAECRQLAARYGNVYVSSTLYRDRKRSASQALDSRILFLDDAPEHPALPYSMVVQTSASSRHAYYLLDRPISPAERRQLQRQLATALGSDQSGADVEQVVRVPESRNTKRGGAFPVTLTQHTAAVTITQLTSVYQLDNIKAPLPAPAPTCTRWNGSLEGLLNAQGLPRRITSSFARRLFTETWPDTSARRAALARSLIFHGYPDDEAIALLIHFGASGSERKGNDWLISDCIRLVAKYRAQNPKPPTPSYRFNQRASTPPPPPKPCTPKSRARKDRPQRLTLASFRRKLDQLIDTSGLIMLTRQQLADHLKISLATLDRLELALEKQGELRRITAPHRRTSWLIVGAQAIATSARGISTAPSLRNVEKSGALNITPSLRNVEKSGALNIGKPHPKTEESGALIIARTPDLKANLSHKVEESGALNITQATHNVEESSVLNIMGRSDLTTAPTLKVEESSALNITQNTRDLEAIPARFSSDDECTDQGFVMPQNSEKNTEEFYMKEHTAPSPPESPLLRMIARYRAGDYTRLDIPSPSEEAAQVQRPQRGRRVSSPPPTPVRSSLSAEQLRRMALADAAHDRAARTGIPLSDEEFWTIGAGRPPGSWPPQGLRRPRESEKPVPDLRVEDPAVFDQLGDSGPTLTASPRPTLEFSQDHLVLSQRR